MKEEVFQHRYVGDSPDLRKKVKPVMQLSDFLIGPWCLDPRGLRLTRLDLLPTRLVAVITVVYNAVQYPTNAISHRLTDPPPTDHVSID